MADLEPRELRQQYADDTAEWDDIRKEAQTDMRYVAGDPWTEKDKTDRRDAGRPCLALDELGQYVNQIINDVRQNKRGIKVSPVGRGANDLTANFRQGKIRDIEYRSNAQQAYTTMFENAIQRSYGFLRISARYVQQAVDDPHPSALDQELWIDPVVNPDMVTPDPYAIRADSSDMTRLWYQESWSRKDFQAKWPKASLPTDWANVAPTWVSGDRVMVAERWIKEVAGTKKLLLLKPEAEGGQPRAIFADSKAMPPSDQILKTRDIEQFKVRKQLTNGLETLETTDWPGTSIPWVSCYGKILYVDQGAGSKRRILSLVRLARDPYMLYCYYRTCEAELVGMTPKFPYFVYEGQLSPAELGNLQKSLHQPIAVVQIKPMLDSAGQTVLPFPSRQPYEPPIQGLEMGAEAARRAIQAGMGMSPLPTQAQRQNEKSGVALRQIEESGQKGTFHFVDHFDDAITRTGAILDELIPHYYDTARETSIRKPDDSVAMIRVNDPAKKYSNDLEEADTPQAGHIDASMGDHDVTISVGPAMASERQASSDFVDTLVSHLRELQFIGPQKMAEITAAAIRLKGLGPIGDEMANIISPPPDQIQPQQAQAAMQENQQLKQQLQQAAQMIENKTAEKRMEIDSKEKIAANELAFKADMAAKDRELKLAIAELNDKGQQRDLFLAERERLGLQAHEANEGAKDRVHELNIETIAHENALEQADAGVTADAMLADQSHQHALDAQAQAPEAEA